MNDISMSFWLNNIIHFEVGNIFISWSFKQHLWCKVDPGNPVAAFSVTTVIWLCVCVKFCNNAMSPWYFDPRRVSVEEEDEILNKIMKNSSMDINHCLIWERGVKRDGYPQMQLGLKYAARFGDRPYDPGHVLFCLENEIVLDTEGFHVSHLYHNKRCINPSHLVYEPGHVNKARAECVTRGVCVTHTYKDGRNTCNYKDFIFFIK